MDDVSRYSLGIHIHCECVALISFPKIQFRIGASLNWLAGWRITVEWKEKVASSRKMGLLLKLMTDVFDVDLTPSRTSRRNSFTCFFFLLYSIMHRIYTIQMKMVVYQIHRARKKRRTEQRTRPNGKKKQPKRLRDT